MQDPAPRTPKSLPQINRCSLPLHQSNNTNQVIVSVVNDALASVKVWHHHEKHDYNTFSEMSTDDDDQRRSKFGGRFENSVSNSWEFQSSRFEDVDLLLETGNV
jgi:hypothetical protein